MNQVTARASVPGTIHVYAGCPAIISNIPFFSCQNRPSSDNKSHVHPVYKHSGREQVTVFSVGTSHEGT